MKTKITFAMLFCLIASFSFAQIDSAKVFYVNGKKVNIGRYYLLELSGKSQLQGKLIAVNKYSVLFYSENNLMEFANDDIISFKEIESEISDNLHYSGKQTGINKPLYSLSAGYSQKYSKEQNPNYNYYYYYTDDYSGFNGFNLQGDMMIQTSNYFGFRIDLNYIHTFGRRTSGTPYTYSYDTATYWSETDYCDLNVLTLKSGILFGDIARDNKVCFYLYLGLGMGYAFGDADLNYQYRTKGNETSVNVYSIKSYNVFSVGAHGSIRLSFNLLKNYSFFVEPSFQYWSNNIERVINLNSGITFHL